MKGGQFEQWDGLMTGQMTIRGHEDLGGRNRRGSREFAEER